MQLVIITKWTKSAAKRVKGDIEVFDLRAGNPNLVGIEVGSSQALTKVEHDMT